MNGGVPIEARTGFAVSPRPGRAASTAIRVLVEMCDGSGREVKTMKTNFALWLKAAAVRAIKTLAQTAVATIGTTAVLSEVDWVLVASASALAAILSILTSVAGLPEVKTE